jgi:hypothetical protein
MFLAVYISVLAVLFTIGFVLGELGKTHKVREFGSFLVVAAVVLFLPAILMM